MTKLLKLLKNLGKIKEYGFAVFFIILKIKNVIGAIENELDNTKLGRKLAEYLPRVKAVLEKVVDAVKKILEFMGEDVESKVPAEALEIGDLEKELDDLENIGKGLKL